MTKSQKSQTHTRAGSGAAFLTVFSLVWDALVLILMVPDRSFPLWFKAVFVLAGVAFTWSAVHALRQRLKGGGVSLQLDKDPVPHGVPVAVEFKIDRSIGADQWVVEAKIESSERNQSGFGLVWVQDHVARRRGTHCVVAQVCFPSDMPATAASDRDTNYRATLTLKAGGLEWNFNLQTRDARSTEVQVKPHDTSHLGNKKPTYPQEEMATVRKRLTLGLYVYVALALMVSLSFAFDFDLWTRAKGLFRAAPHTTSVNTANG